MKFAVTLPSVLALAAARQVPLYSTYTFNPLEHLAGSTPYFEPEIPQKSPDLPQGCSVERAAYLVRHAAINANDFDLETYIQPFLYKLGNATTVDWSKVPGLSFLATWEPPSFAETELLTRTGKAEASQLGVSLSYRYQKLRAPQRIWADSSERTVKTAEGLVRAFEADDDQINVVTVKGGKTSGADSLKPYSGCSGYQESAGNDEEERFNSAYTAPVIARLADAVPGFNFTTDDVIGMQELCGYDTVIRGSSPFCSDELFTPDEWLQFEYGQDIHYHYTVGYGSEASGALGFPWLNATMNLLTADADGTDGAAPDQDLYISVAHRELPPVVLVTLGLFNNSASTGANDINATMPAPSSPSGPAEVNHQRAWVSSHILPFLTNIGIERLNCSTNLGVKKGIFPAGANSSSSSSSSSSSNSSSSAGSSNNTMASTTYYRVLVNNAPQPLPGCLDGPAQSCSAQGLADFLSSREDMFGDFAQACGTPANESTTLNIFTSADNGTMVGKRGFGGAARLW